MIEKDPRQFASQVVGRLLPYRDSPASVRRALGATAGDVLWLVARSATGVTAAGAVLGLALSAVLGRLLATMLFGVQPSDPATFAFVTVVLALTAAVSTIGPAWRATRIDPAVTLRQE